MTRHKRRHRQRARGRREGRRDRPSPILIAVVVLLVLAFLARRVSAAALPL